MAEQPVTRGTLENLLQQAARQRDLAKQARQLAAELGDSLARAGLRDRAEEFERRAAALEAEAAALGGRAEGEPRPAPGPRW